MKTNFMTKTFKWSKIALSCLLAVALGWGDRNWTPADLREAIRAEVEGYAAVSEEEMAGGGLLKKGLFVSTGAL